MKLHAEAVFPDGPPYAVIDDEPDPQRRDLLFDFMRDSDGSEDLVLSALDHAESGTPELRWGDHYVNIDMHPDGRVVITQIEHLLEDDQNAHPPQMVITIAEARKLILDWIAARDRWYAEREAQGPQTDKPTDGPQPVGLALEARREERS